MVLVPVGDRVHTSENVRLVHVVCAEDDDSAGSAALQQWPDLVSGTGVHARRGLVQEQDLTGTNIMQTAHNGPKLIITSYW